MKKAIYINCWTDPWIKVAEQIREQFGIEPGYWIGYQEELKEETIKETFKGVIYHSDHDAWCSRFPLVVEEHFEEENLSIDFLRQNPEYELMALKMLDLSAVHELETCFCYCIVGSYADNLWGRVLA